MTVSRSIHIAANGIISLVCSLLWLSDIPLYICVCVCVCVCVCIQHIFFTHSSVEGCLGCVHVLAIVNSAAVNTGVHVSFQILVFSSYMPRSEIVG